MNVKDKKRIDYNLVVYFVCCNKLNFTQILLYQSIPVRFCTFSPGANICVTQTPVYLLLEI